MDLPFTPEQFFDVFARYNTAVWPAQVLWNLLALVAIALVFRRGTGPVIATILAALWLWMGIAYHWAFFAGINKVAYGFGALFVVQGLLFLVHGARRRRLSFARPNGVRGIAGGLLMTYGLLVYPLLGHSLGHTYPQAPTFGLPCPTTIFTLGLLLWTTSAPRWWLLLIPLLWSLIGTMAAFKLGVREDIGLLVAGIAFVGLGFRRRVDERVGATS
ncbi:MAG: hypothetical protein KIT10_09680 [Flavobacteriales bacterium]|nr:hypothetical protein [Flavobacteriales bacterium]